MKLTLLFILFAVLQLNASLYSQNNMLTINVQNASMRDVFKEIEKQSELRFFYNDLLTNVDRKLSLSANNLKIEDLLDKLLDNTDIAYKIMENNLILISPKTLLQQGITISGSVVSGMDNMPLAGVNVVEKGTMNGTVTDIDGNFTIMVENKDAVLVLSYVGYLSEEITVGEKTSLYITMAEDIASLEEVVVVGYGTQKRATLTGSVSNVKGEELKRSSSVNVSNSLVGRLTGVIANNRSGEPGNDDSRIFIRGISTFRDNSNSYDPYHRSYPLYVIDGVAEREGFSRLNPEDIESITVLKDASAAIYGARAANGVILITTKRGKIGKPVITFNSKVGFQQPTRFPEFMNSYQYAVWFNEINELKGVPPQFTQNDLDLFQSGENPVTHPNTDYYSETVRNWSPQTEQSILVSGGNEVVRYFLSGRYLFQDAVYKNSFQNYNQYNLRSNIDINIVKNLKVGLNFDGRYEDRQNPNFVANEVWKAIINAFPTQNAYYPNGLPGAGVSRGLNPVLLAEGKTGYNNFLKEFINSSVTFDLQLPFILDGLYISGMGAFDFYDGYNSILSHPWDAYVYHPTTDEYENVRESTASYVSMAKTFQNRKKHTFLSKLGYNKQLGNHNFNFFVAAERFKNEYNELYGYKKDHASAELDMISAGGEEGMKVSDDKYIYTRLNYFGRLSYSYKEKYMAEFTLRRDASQNFPEKGRWGTFPGVSVGWRLSEETFFKNAVGFVNHLKFRASWGLMGNDNINPFQYVSRFALAGTLLNPEGYYFGADATFYQGLEIPVYANPSVTWETADTRNVGLESQFWDGLLSLDVDLFTSTRTDILLPRSASIPEIVGLGGSLPDENIGKLNNKGIEAILSHANNIGQFMYNIGGNISYARNEVIFMDEAINTPEWQKREGKPLSDEGYLFYNAIGIYHTEEEVNTLPKPPQTYIGQIIYEDVNGDSLITADDRIRPNYTATPQIIYGINFDFYYKGFALNILFQGQAKAKQMIRPLTNADCNFPEYLFEGRWTEDNPDADKVRAFDRQVYNPSRASTYWIKDAWFLRLKSAEFSYTLPKSLTNRLKISNMRVFINGFNLFVIDEIKYYDPETTSIAGDYYPQQRIINAGINLSL